MESNESESDPERRIRTAADGVEEEDEGSDNRTSADGVEEVSDNPTFPRAAALYPINGCLRIYFKHVLCHLYLLRAYLAVRCDGTGKWEPPQDRHEYGS